MNIIDSLLSINFNPGHEGHNIKNIVLYTMSGTVSGIDALFVSSDSKASVHYGIGLNGVITFQPITLLSFSSNQIPIKHNDE